MHPDYPHTVTFPPGMEINPLYVKCPRCGCDLQDFYESEQEKICSSNRISYEFFEHLNQLVPGSVAINREAGRVTLTGCNLREFIRHSHHKHESPQSNKDFIPGIKGKLREWVGHFRKFLFQPIGRG